MTDIVYEIATAVILTVLAMTLLINNFVQYESRFVQWFSHVTSSPRWFTVWILVMILWVAVRRILLEHHDLGVDADFVIATILWSGVPFMVENLLKSTTARQMAILTELALHNKTELLRSVDRDHHVTELVTEVKLEMDRSIERDSTMHALLERLLEAIEDRVEGGDVV